MLQFSNHKCVDTVNRIAPNLPTALVYRQRGKRGGKNRKTPVQKKLCLPSLVLANARAVNNKTDELIALIKYHYAYKNASAIAITETWLHGDIDDSIEYRYCLLHGLCSCILRIKQDKRNIDLSANMAAHNTPCAGAEH